MCWSINIFEENVPISIKMVLDLGIHLLVIWEGLEQIVQWPAVLRQRCDVIGSLRVLSSASQVYSCHMMPRLLQSGHNFDPAPSSMARSVDQYKMVLL